jgi:hypothetical protein
MASSEQRRWKRRWLPDSLLGRIMVVMALGVVSAQLAGTLLWALQLRDSARTEALGAGRHMALNAAGAIRFFRDLPPQFRPILIEQLRTTRRACPCTRCAAMRWWMPWWMWCVTTWCATSTPRRRLTWPLPGPIACRSRTMAAW